MPKPIVEFDVETTGLQWYAHKTFLAQFGWKHEEAVEVLDLRSDDPAVRERIQWWFDRWLPEEDDAEFEAWNSKFDMHFAESEGFRMPPLERWHDAMVKGLLIDERFGAALKQRDARMFGEAGRDTEKAVKEWLAAEQKRRQDASKAARIEWLREHSIEGRGRDKRNGGFLVAQLNEEVPPDVGRYEPPNYSDVPDELMYPYAEDDIHRTRRLSKVYDDALDAAPVNEATGWSLRRVYEEMERPTLAALYDIERRGFPTDVQAIRLFQHELAINLEQLEARNRELAGKSNFNPGSSDQIAEALKRRGADLSLVTKSSKTGKLKMDAENLDAIDDELATAVQEFRGESKMMGTYIMPLLERTWDSSTHSWREPFLLAPGDERIHGNLRQYGARTARMSAAEPNMQNIPRDDLRLRYALRAEPGHKLVVVDLSGIELVLFAMFVGPGRLKDAIMTGADMHALTAKMAELPGRQRVNGFESPRSQGKVMNYQIVYGGGVNTISKKFRLPRPEAKKKLDLYHRAYPEVKQLQRRIEQRLRAQGYIETPYGHRHRVVSVQQEGYKFTNYLVQGTAAELIKQAVVRVYRAGIPMVAVIHDEIVAHVPEEQAEQTQATMIEAMTTFPELTEPTGLAIEAEGDIVDRWSQAKNPDFIPTYMELA